MKVGGSCFFPAHLPEDLDRIEDGGIDARRSGVVDPEGALRKLVLMEVQRVSITRQANCCTLPGTWVSIVKRTLASVEAVARPARTHRISARAAVRRRALPTAARGHVEG
jgi:hypothetical protein